MLEIIDLSFGYIKQPICLKDIDLKLNKGELALVLGGEESGKTSLLRLIAGLEEQYFGKILIDGKEGRELSIANRNISYLQKEPVFFERKSILKNLQYLFNVLEKECPSEEQIKEVFDKFNFNVDLNIKVKRLELYQKKILSIIRSYLKNPAIILIDDLFFDESKEHIEYIKNAIYTLKSLKNDVIMIICSKKEYLFTNIYSNIYYLSFGRLYKISSIEELKNNPIDISAMNYFKNNQLKINIVKIQDDYFLKLFEDEVVSKKKTIQKETARIKLSSKFNESLDKEKFKPNYNYDVILCSYEDFDIKMLSDKEINDMIKSKKIFLFNTNGSRIIL